MAIRSLIRSLRSGIKYDDKGRSFLPTNASLQSMGYDPNAKSFGLFGSKSGKLTSSGSGEESRSRKTHSAVNSAISQGDILLVDTSKFDVKKEVRESVINIYNPKRVFLNSKDSHDPTTRAEKREQELEARRQRSLSLMSGRIGAGGAAAAASGSAGLAGSKSGSRDDNESENSSSNGLVNTLLRFIVGGSAFSAGKRFFAPSRAAAPPTTDPPPKPRPLTRVTPKGSPTRVRSKVPVVPGSQAGVGLVDDAVRIGKTIRPTGIGFNPRLAGAIAADSAEIAGRGRIGQKMASGAAQARVAAGAGLRGVNAMAGVGTFGLSIVAEILAQVAAHRAGKLSDEILQQQINLKYPYGKGMFALKQVMEMYAGQPASKYHTDAGLALSSMLRGYEDENGNHVPGFDDQVEQVYRDEKNRLNDIRLDNIGKGTPTRPKE